MSSIEKQFLMPDYPGLFDEYSQMVIQFGYIALFAPACPLARLPPPPLHRTRMPAGASPPTPMEALIVSTSW